MNNFLKVWTRVLNTGTFPGKWLNLWHLPLFLSQKQILWKKVVKENV